MQSTDQQIASHIDIRFLKLFQLATRLLVLGEQKKPIEAILVAYSRVQIELTILRQIIPDSVIEGTDFARHVDFIAFYLNKSEPENCISDMRDLVDHDIVALAHKFNAYVQETKPEISYDWELLHPEIRRVSERLFQTGHFFEAVEAAAKEIVTIVKEDYYQATGKEEDGKSLMSRAFGKDSVSGYPVLPLNDLSTESNRSAQEGYMHLCMGLVLAIRNPRAHMNAYQGDADAWPEIMFCSQMAHLLLDARKFRDIENWPRTAVAVSSR